MNEQTQLLVTNQKQPFYMRWKRKLEVPAYGVCPFIGEFWNTMSNLPFIIIGLYRLFIVGVPIPIFWDLYLLYISAGVCSAIHHTCAHIPGNKWSIFVDWFPIGISLVINIILFAIHPELFETISILSGVLLIMAFTILISDHICTPCKVPFGHSLWHIFAALAIDCFYQDIISSILAAIERENVVEFVIWTMKKLYIYN